MQPLEAGDLTELRLVGSGGFGVVQRGRSRKLGMDVALKTVWRRSGADSSDLEKEREMMSRANYTYVLRLLGVYDKREGEHCEYGLVMEYMPYGSLYTLFDKILDVPWSLRFQIIHQVALGMNYLHHALEPPIIHRDLKPSNVLLNKSLDVQLTDFGLAKNENSGSSSVSFAGTVSYMPPEALPSDKSEYSYKPTKKFDVYSFAILAWSVLSGCEPYSDIAKNMVQLLITQNPNNRPDIKLVEKWESNKMVREAKRLMQECWDGDPGKRPSFSAIINRTPEMQEAYKYEIHHDVEDVSRKLQNLSSLSARDKDTLDGRNGLKSDTNIQDSNTFSISIFQEVIDQIRRAAVSPDTPKDHNQDALEAEEFLQSHFSQIVQSKPDLSDILDDLYSSSYLTQETMDMIQSGTPQEQVRKTLRMIINNGKASCHEFLRLLKIHYPSLMTSLRD
ncbi:receptor-interacting serine/threonine-protein kinase 2-like isoform X2 [Pseudophryne corroboree]|uniref:receptor-interacting serine/threonine-protein kinase 2-like isoform X2 n=1 Tax=Pseudophryne corroboree TaxID=495146 RepID=UPI0030821773